MKNIIVLGIITVCIWLMYRYPHVMINPGELIEAHQDLNNKCRQCHEPFWGISNDKCITCHKPDDIGKDTTLMNEANMSQEIILFHNKLSGQKCTDCHTDHKGMKPEMSISNFTHDFLSEAVRNNCKSCHGKPEDKLHKTLEAECSRCHNTGGWKSNVAFDHSLLSAIEKNNCVSCHQKPDDSYHHLFKGNCSKCHSTTKWKPADFDHSSYFVLDKDHNAECSTCHKSNNFSMYTCYGCHEHTESQMVRKHNEEGIFNITKCASCHKSGDEHDIRMRDNSGREMNQQEMKDVKKYIKSKEKGKENKNEDGDD